MIIEIKGIQYVDPPISNENGVFMIRVTPVGGFGSLVDDFLLQPGDEIIQLNDNEQIIGVWHVQSMNSIEMPKPNGDGMADIRYNVSQIGVEAQDAIQADVIDNTDAVLELCSLIAEMAEEQSNNFADYDERIASAQQDIEEKQRTMDQQTISISQLETMFNNLADRVARLENVSEGG